MEIEGKFSLTLKTSILLMATFTIYWQDLILIAKDAINSDLFSYILAIPLLLTYIIYRIRKILVTTTSNHYVIQRHTSVTPNKDIIGAMLCTIAYIIKWYGSYSFQPIEYHIMSLPIFIAGLTLIIFNPQTLRTLLFPIAFLLFLIPPPLRLAQKVGSILAIFSSQTAFNFLKTCRLPVTLSNTYMSPVIYLETNSGTLIPFSIDLACSGLYSMIGFIIFAVFMAYITREHMHKKLTIIVVGLPIIYSLNILRIILTVILGHNSGINLALKIFHFLGGWIIILIGTLIILTITEKALKIRVFKSSSETCTHYKKNENEAQCIECGKILKTNQNKLSRKDALKIAFIITVTTLLSFIQVPVFALTEGSAEVIIQQSTGEQTTTRILPEIEGYDLRFMYRDIEFEKVSGQNASLIYQYLPEIPRKPIWIGIEVGPIIWQLHRWEVCLITSPESYGSEASVTQLDLRDIHL
ncbi:MAG: exosortase/archaeosortase family protein, partial [Candidatus Hodarchaeota archaeon]